MDELHSRAAIFADFARAEKGDSKRRACAVHFSCG